MGNWDVSKPDNDGERELLDRAVKALEAELATKTCNKQIASKLEDAELARDSEETCNNKQVISKLVASEDERMTREEIKNIPELVDLMIDKCVLADSKSKVCKKLKKVCDLAIKALEQEPSENAIYKVGDVVRTLVDIDAEGYKLFPKGTIGIITDIADYKDSLYPYKVDANEDWWYYNADMIEPVDEGGTPKQKPCEDDLIQRQAVLDIINFEDKWLLDAKGHNANTRIAFGGMRSKVSALPFVNPKQSTGHWIIISPTDMYCSECNEIEHLDTSRKFCAYCGTMMLENPTDSESEE